jgi:hypothetical protein
MSRAMTQLFAMESSFPQARSVSTEIIRSGSSPTASESGLETTFATSVSRGRRSQPPDRRVGFQSLLSSGQNAGYLIRTDGTTAYKTEKPFRAHL